MKQSTKLLSMLLAFLIAFSCLSVIGSAALDKNSVTYDGIDDAALTYKQVATMALTHFVSVVLRISSIHNYKSRIR